MTQDREARQRELLTPYVAASDAVITTAAVPGRPAPLLVTTAMVEAMRPGSVVVDLAAESGGNCELSRPGEDVEHVGVLVWGAKDVPSTMPVHASQLYARNLVNLLLLMTTDGQVVPDFDDEIVAASCVTRKDGAT
jgi:NAD(P) transhydrogenase subunit alpha